MVCDTLKMPPRNRDFYREIRLAGIQNLDFCYQCSACSNGCPLAFAMDYYPNQLVHMIRLGLENMVLSSRTIWICTSCATCATRCPNKIDIVYLMDVLRRKSLQQKGVASERVIQTFHKTFINEIKKRGRISELPLLLLYKMKIARSLKFDTLLEEVRLGIMMLKKRKLRLSLAAMDDMQDIRRIFMKIPARQKPGDGANQ